MRIIIRNVAINALVLSLLPVLLTGVKISGGLPTLIVGGIILSLMFIFLRPVLNIFALPLNFMTFGFFSFVINVFIFYLLTLFVFQIQINPFVFSGLNFAGFIIPEISFNSFFAFVITSFVFSFIVSAIEWLIKK